MTSLQHDRSLSFVVKVAIKKTKTKSSANITAAAADYCFGYGKRTKDLEGVQPRSDDEFQMVDAAEHNSGKGGLVPLHSACHNEMTELLLEHRINVKVVDSAKCTLPNIVFATRKTSSKVRTFTKILFQLFKNVFCLQHSS